jgi:hypothetical protein
MKGERVVKYKQRFSEAMSHCPRYFFAGQVRLAKDCRIGKMSISRLLKGENNPSYRVVHLVVEAMEKQLGVRIDARDLISYSDKEWDRSICDVCGCSGCLPPGALMDNGELHPLYENVKPGTWKSYLPLNQSINLYHRED